MERIKWLCELERCYDRGERVEHLSDGFGELEEEDVSALEKKWKVNIPVVFWVVCIDGWVPSCAFQVAEGCFVARAVHENGLHIGHFKRDKGCFLSYGGAGFLVEGRPFEVLCVRNGNALVLSERPDGVLQAGFEANGTRLSVGCAVLEDRQDIVPGKCSPSFHGCNVAFDGKEITAQNFKYVSLKHPDVVYISYSWLGLKPPMKLFLSNVTELLDWDCPGEMCVNISRFLRTKSQCPGILLCHDMMGGYCKASDEDYLNMFTSWDLISCFVYFSHQFVSIPPKSWIDACKANGKPCLGTIITEHSVGSSQNESLLRDRVRSVKQLVRLCEFYGFDGYLVNIESPLTTAYVEPFKAFLSELNAECHVIYYDSLNSNGDIEYQNALTEENIDFFNACDGIFTNYWWDRDEKNKLEQSIALAEPGRTSDVFMGIDIFARGVTYEQGTDAHRIIASALSKGLSIAIFAPGWSLECGPAQNSCTLEEQQNLDRQFWQKLLQQE